MPKVRILVQLSEDGVVVREYQRFAKSTATHRKTLLEGAMGQIQLWESVNFDNLWLQELQHAREMTGEILPGRSASSPVK